MWPVLGRPALAEEWQISWPGCKGPGWHWEGQLWKSRHNFPGPGVVELWAQLTQLGTSGPGPLGMDSCVRGGKSSQYSHYRPWQGQGRPTLKEGMHLPWSGTPGPRWPWKSQLWKWKSSHSFPGLEPQDLASLGKVSHGRGYAASPAKHSRSWLALKRLVVEEGSVSLAWYLWD